MSGLPKPREGWSLGLDVSTFQGPISAELAEELCRFEARFLFARATHGLTLDRQFADTVASCAAASVAVGAYGVLTPSGDAEVQARFFIDAVRNLQLDLPPVLDFEVAIGLSAQEALSRARRWLDAVEDALGRQAIIYTGPSFWSGLVKLAGVAGVADAAAIATRPLWVAHYRAHEPSVPPAWETWTIWQASGNGAATLPGTNIDVDVDWFRGDVDELRALGRGSVVQG